VDSALFGRDRELEVGRAFLEGGTARGLVIEGPAGIGKTSVWRALVATARENGYRVLECIGDAADARLTFVGVADLLGEVADDVLPRLPSPQAFALEVALLRVGAGDAVSEPRAVAAGVLGALRMLARRQPVLVAIDDAPSLDPASTEAVAFAARRLRDEQVRFLLTRRPRTASPLERALAPLALLEVGPLSLGAMRRMLAERLDLTLPRQLIRRIFESTLGNPLFALELGRTLAEQGLPAVDEDLPIPGTVEELLGTRVTRLPPPVRTVLLAVALDGQLRVSQLATIAEPDALDDAVDAGIVMVDGDRVRPAHPLLAAAVKTHARAAERRRLHRELAAIADETLRPRHLALATSRPDAELATRLAKGAADASARGARREALELAEHALRLTPVGRDERSERILSLARYLGQAGEPHRAIELIESELDSLPPGRARAQAWIFLANRPDVTPEQFDLRLERASAEGKGDPAIAAELLASKANFAAAVCVARIPEAEAWALESLGHARHAGPGIEQLALYALAWAQSLSGRSIDDLRARVASDSGAELYVRASLDRVICDRLGWRGELARARAIVTQLMALADERGEERSYFALLSQRCEIELRAGELDEASDLLDEWNQSSTDRFVSPVYERCRALVALVRGRPAEAERLVADVITRAETLAKGWDLLEGLRVQGVAALLAHEPARAVESLNRVWEYTNREGINDPGAFPVAPDLVEGLVEIGEVEEARAVTDRLRELAERQEHPWGLATSKRCAAMLSTDYEETKTGLAEAASAYGERGLRFDRARSLLILGRAERRVKKWGAARHSLELAAEAFDEIGSTGWAELARSELGRVGARRPGGPDELTPAERRVVELAAAGHSNKEIAQTLFVTINTVEGHLSHAYAKLGVRSRAQLAHRLQTDESVKS
jgi:DNA-binding CsgD family transcriptional regulator